MPSEKQIAANHRNSKMAGGPNNTDSTRYNATTHGLYSDGVTKTDEAEGYPRILADLMREKNPVGVLDTHRVECMARDIVRRKRAFLWESMLVSRYVPSDSYKSQADDDRQMAESQIVNPPFLINSILEMLGHVLRVQRCEAFYANDLVRNEHELERSQRMRQGEQLPAPALIDLTLRNDTGTVSATPVASTERVPPTKVIEALPSTPKSGLANEPREPVEPRPSATDPPDDQSETVRPVRKAVDPDSSVSDALAPHDHEPSGRPALWQKADGKPPWRR